MSVSGAAGAYFVDGEAPLVTIVVTDPATGNPIDHTTIIEDTDGKEGCLETGCPTPDGMWSHAYLFVHGPRANRGPVLTTAARATVVSDGPGPFNLNASGADLTVTVDQGKDIWTSNVDMLAATFTVDVADGTFVNVAQATGAEIVTWLNDNDDFAARAIAELNGDGEVELRSRNVGGLFAILRGGGDVTEGVFDGDTDVAVVGGYYPRNDLKQFTDPTSNDPKAAWTTGSITYQLDTVDDLQPGTYIASVEFAEAGRISGTNYRTPSVAKVTFDVNTTTEEPFVADSCNSCHQNADGEGYILDYARHYKMFDNGAVDQCGACHDYQDGNDGGGWFGGKPLNQRVHAIHYGADLTYPIQTVWYNRDPVAGRNWEINFPQDVLYCEACHSETGTSGSWMDSPSTLPCKGCHDGDAAQTHYRLMTYDPTPDSPYNGDEQESCEVCH